MIKELAFTLLTTISGAQEISNQTVYSAVMHQHTKSSNNTITNGIKLNEGTEQYSFAGKKGSKIRL
ncbi:hypothetical protein [Thalassotalea marina]|uniref:Uncharacterized protein n=1 Tax=Thalassotalea marina TaxID=1673741 RepID=A0A919BRF7_9GAMM|nr:hypothetical protein [Thalassotalea marina]GHG07960.1 hypothetical protein GCM10017161_42190 [Thalassotalea marina]